MGQVGVEAKLGNDLDFNYLTDEHENVMGGEDSASHALPLMSVDNQFSGTVNQVQLNNMVNTNMSGGSHCWDKDGGFHVVCIFVMAVGIMCSLLTLVCAYKIYRLVIDIPGSEPTSTASSVKIINSRNSSESSTKTRQSQSLHSLMVDSDKIETVQTDMVVMHNKLDQQAEIVNGNCLC